MAALKTGLGALGALIKDVKTLSGWITKGIVAAPLADFVLGFGPPWPTQLPILTSCLEIIALILVLSYWKGRGSARLRRLLTVFALLAGLALVAYLLLSSQLIFAAPNGERYIAGFILRPDLVPLITPEYGISGALRDAGWDAEAIWTRSSITMARTALVTVWLAMFGFFVACLGVFALRQRGTDGRRTR